MDSNDNFFLKKIRRIKEKVITFKTESRHESGHPKKEENVYVVYEQLFYEQTRSIFKKNLKKSKKEEIPQKEGNSHA